MARGELANGLRGFGYAVEVAHGGKLLHPRPRRRATSFLLRSRRFGTVAGMSDDPERLTLADREDLASAIAFALRFSGRKRVHNADEFMGGQKKALKPVHRGTGD